MLDVSKIDFSKVEGVTDARLIHNNAKHIIEMAKKGFTLATSEETFPILVDAFNNSHPSKEDKENSIIILTNEEDYAALHGAMIDYIFKSEEESKEDL